MIEVLGFVLLRPYWLLGLLGVAFLVAFFAPRVPGLASWNHAMDPQLLEAMRTLGRVAPGIGGRDWMPVCVAAITAVALVGPAKRDVEGTSFRNLRGMVIVLDASKSVTESPDFRPAVTAMRQLLQAAGSRPVAFVVYAGDAYLVSTFTTDHAVLSTTMSAIDGTTVPDIGSRHERGLEFAGHLLSDAQIIAGDVVIVTDGDQMNENAIRYAAAIRDVGGRVSTLFVQDNAGPGPSDRNILAAVAVAGGGSIANVRDPNDVVNLLAARENSQLDNAGLRSLVWNDYGRYLLFFALFPALAMFRRRG